MLMAKVYPFSVVDSLVCSSSSTSYKTTKAETFTIWMKSLVMQTNGCTVYNEGGEIVYRVDNYDKKCSNDVYLMDLHGKVLFTILRRKRWLFGQYWKGYKWDGLTKSRTQKPFFQARERFGMFDGNWSCEISHGSGNEHVSYRLEALAGKFAFKIANSNGTLVAKAERKQSSKGVLLGDDVLKLVVEAGVDRSFIMALVTVYGLMHHKL